MNLFNGPDLMETTSTEVKNLILKPSQMQRANETGALYYGDKDGKPTAFGGASTTSSGGVEKLVQWGPNLERERNQQTIDFMQQEFQFRRRGKIGIGPNKAAIAIRFDDGQTFLKNNVVALMQARDLPFSIVLISRWDEVAWGSGASAADITSEVNRGAEVFSHGLDHQDYIGYQGLYDNVVLSKSEIESKLPTVKVQGFALPGVDLDYAAPGSTPVTPEQRGSDLPYGGLTKVEHWNGAGGRLLMSHYPMAEAYSGPVRCRITDSPSLYLYGRSHIGLDYTTLAQAKAAVDQAVIEKCSLRFMAHPATFGTAQSLFTLADFTSFLDYLVQLRDAETIEIVMPSSLPFVTNTTSRLDLMAGRGNLVNATNNPAYGWNSLGGIYNILSESGGHNGLPSFQMNASGSHISQPLYLVTDCTIQGYAGETFEFRGWAKSVDTSNTQARIDITAGGTAWSVGKSVLVGLEEKLIRLPFTIPKIGPNGEFIGSIAIKPGRWGGSGIIWSDMSCVKL